MPCVALTTLGCKVNQYETETMEGLFRQKGYQVVSFDEQADVYVINTCSVTHLGEKKSRQLIRRALRLNPEAVIAVTGCYSQIAAEQVAKIEGVKVILGTRERHKIVDLVEQAASQGQPLQELTNIMQAKEFEDIPLMELPERTRAFLKIQEGCQNFCTYCIIPYTRGPLRSRNLASVCKEAQKLIEAGFQEIVLTGIHLGAYGRDLPEDIELADAVEAILALGGDLQRLRLGSLESIEVSPKLVRLFTADKRLCPHLHLPLQAGEDGILQAMHRHYTTRQYKEMMDGLLRAIPDLAISTDVIVGFPGESETSFQQSLAFIETIPFARIHVFPYSRREGTPAASYGGQVEEQVKRQRAQAMQVLADCKADVFHRSFIGRKMPVLWETEHGGIVNGLTANYLRIYGKGDAFLQPGKNSEVRLEKPYKDGIWASSF